MVKATCPNADEKGRIALDFGSTHSAAAVTVPKKCKDVHGIHLVEKFPTRLLVEDKSTSPLRLSFLGPGKDIATKGEKVQYPKALLMQMTTKPVYDERLTEGIMTANEGFDLPEEPEVAAMFLDGLWDEALEVLRTNFHGNGSNSHVVLTYPGCWNAAELSRLQTAVELSKIPKQACPTCPIEYVKEQVAATYAILAHHKAEAIELRKSAGSFMVVDCGGMTIDPALFRFDKTIGAAKTGHPLVRGDFISDDRGCMAGALAIDFRTHDELLRLLKDKTKVMSGIGIQQTEMGELKECYQEGIAAFMDRLQRDIKPNFTGTVPWKEGWPFEEVGGEVLEVRRQHMLRVFDKTSDCVARFIREQILGIQAESSRPSLLFLTGGLSLSPRFRYRTERTLKSLLRENKIDCPKFVWDAGADVAHAVCRGALVMQLSSLLNYDEEAPGQASELK